MPGGVGGVQVIGPYPDQTPLDPSDAIVLFADLQAGIIERAATNDLASLRRTVAALAKLAQPRPGRATTACRLRIPRVRSIRRTRAVSRCAFAAA